MGTMNTAPQSTDTVRETLPMPTTAQDIHDAARRLRGMRRRGLSWREISEQTGYSRVQALQLVHNVFALIDATNNGPANLSGGGQRYDRDERIAASA